MWSKTKTTRLEKVVKQFVVLMPTAFMAIAGKFSYSKADKETQRTCKKDNKGQVRCFVSKQID